MIIVCVHLTCTRYNALLQVYLRQYVVTVYYLNMLIIDCECRILLLFFDIIIIFCLIYKYLVVFWLSRNSSDWTHRLLIQFLPDEIKNKLYLKLFYILLLIIITLGIEAIVVHYTPPECKYDGVGLTSTRGTVHFSVLTR